MPNVSNTPKPPPSATDRVAVITIRNPPVNAFNSAVSLALLTDLDRAISDPSIEIIVLTGEGKTFPAGFDIRELEAIADGKRELWDFQAPLYTLESCEKPVVAALHGTVLGGGLELAMAAHYRVAAPGTVFGQPEVKLGLIPGMAGSQRLPRLVGLERAAQMCCYGESIDAATALKFGLINAIADADLIEEAIGFVSQKPVRRTRDLPVRPADLGSFRKKLAGFRRYGSAPAASLDAVEVSANVRFEEGCRREWELFAGRLRSLESKALRYAFFGERAVSKSDGPAREIRRVAVVGGGTMGTGIALALTAAGLSVTLKEVDEERLSRSLGSFRKTLERKLDPAQVEQRLNRLTGQTDYSGFVSQDLVIEAVFENQEVKQGIFGKIAEAVSPDCLLATNTSSLDVDEITAAVQGRHRVLGLHFFSPANVMRLVEVISGRESSLETVASAMSLAKRLGKIAIRSANAPGFIGNRIFAPYLQEARLLVDEGAAVEQVNQALVDWGMAMGPLAVDDLTGLDVLLAIEEEFERRLPGFVLKSSLLRRLVESGHLGQKNGRGWSLYDEDRKARPDPQLASFRKGSKSFTDKEIVDRCISALVAEGRRVLAEGVATDEVAIDMVFLHGFGFPAWRGGPMFFAKYAEVDLAGAVPG